MTETMCERKEINNLSHFLSDAGVDESSQLWHKLVNVPLSNLLQSKTLTRFGMIYAARESQHNFMKKIAISALSEYCNDSKTLNKELSVALCDGNFDDIRKLLIGADGNILLKEVNGYNMISALLVHQCSPEMLQFVIDLFKVTNSHQTDCKSYLNGYDSLGMTPLIASIVSRNVACLKLLLDEGADVDADENLTSLNPFPFKYGSDYERQELSSNIETTEIDKKGESADGCQIKHPLQSWQGLKNDLSSSSQSSGTSEVEKEKPFEQDGSTKQNSFSIANFGSALPSSSKFSVIREACLQDMFYGASKTPVMYAICLEDLQCVETLLQYKPALRKVCLKGLTALSYAALLGNSAVVSLLLKAPPALYKIDYRRLGQSLMRSVYREDDSSTEDQSASSDHKIMYEESVGRSVKRANLRSTVNDDIEENRSDSCSVFKISSQKVCECNEKKTKAQLPSVSLKIGMEEAIRQRNTDRPVLSATRRLRKTTANSNIFICPHTGKETRILPVQHSLPYAVLGKDIECMKLLLPYCPDLDVAHSSGRSALMSCAEMGLFDFAQILLEKGADVNKQFTVPLSDTALMLASYNGHIDCVRLFLEHKADVDLMNIEQKNAFDFAIEGNHPQCLKALIESSVAEKSSKLGCFITRPNDEIINIALNLKLPLVSSITADSKKCFELVLNVGNEYIGLKDWFGFETFNHVAQFGSAYYLEKLLFELKGLDQNKTALTSYSSSPIDEYIEITQIKMPEDDGERKQLIGHYSELALPFSVIGENIPCFELLLKHCKNVLEPHPNDILGKWPLIVHAAGVNKGIDVLRRLVQLGADVNSVTPKGLSAVINAIHNKKRHNLEYILQNGADPDIGLSSEFPTGLNAVSLAVYTEQCDILELLIKHGANVNILTGSIRPLGALMIKYDYEFGLYDALKCKAILLIAGAFMSYQEFPLMIEYERDFCFLRSQELLKELLKDGRITSECREVPMSVLVKMKRFVTHLSENGLNSLQLLMSYGLFDWRVWFNKNTMSMLSYCAVQNKIKPGVWSHGPSQTLLSPLLYALKTECYNLVKYLVRNLYFTWDDYTRLCSYKAVDLVSSNGMDVDGVTDSTSTVDKLTRQPWRLETLCFLKVSTALFEATSSPCARSSQVEALPLPAKLKSVLNFEGQHYNLCNTKWHEIGRLPINDHDIEHQDFLCLTKTVYPNVEPCEDTDTCLCCKPLLQGSFS